MEKKDMDYILHRLRALGFDDETQTKVMRYFANELSKYERSKVDPLIHFVINVLDNNFFSERLEH